MKYTTVRFLLALLLAFSRVSAWAPTISTHTLTRTKPLAMGMFDFLSGAFDNEKFEDRRATASHILVDSEEEALVVAKEIAGGTSFAEAAKTYSACPSASKGGSLGTFEPGVMVQEFDDVVFNPETEVGKVVGPVKTQFGFHIIKKALALVSESTIQLT